MNREERRLLAYRITCNSASDPPAPVTGCTARCPGDRPCCLDHNVYHVLHVCDSPDCLCHQKQRYEAKRSAKKCQS
jgi:hypothetical protein